MEGDFGKLLKAVAKGRHGSRSLSKEEASFAMGSILDGHENDARIAAFLTAMRYKGITSEELAGFLDGMRRRYRTVDINLPDLVDSAGAYDGRSRTLHLSLAGTLIASAAGCRMVTHSGTELPPKKGVTSADVLEALGVSSRCSVQDVLAMFEDTNFTFIHESVYLPEMERFREIRHSLGFRSFVNTCEMAANPLNAKIQFISVAHDHFMKRVAESAGALGVRRAIVITGIESSDEVPLEKVNAVLLSNKKAKEIALDPTVSGLPCRKAEPFRDAKGCAAAIRTALSGEEEGLKQRAIFDGGVKIFLGGSVDSIEQGVERARKVVESKDALNKLNEIIAWSKSRKQ